MSKNTTSLLVSCGSLTAGGAERVLSILSDPFVEHYNSVTYLMWDNLPVFYTINKNIKLISVEAECRSSSLIKKMMWFRRYVLNNRPDVVLSFSTPYNMLTLFALLMTKAKVVAAERIDPRAFRWGKPLEILRDFLYHTATGILAQTEYSRSYYKGKLLEKTSIIYNPVTMPSSLVGMALNTPKEKVIVSAVRLKKQKNLPLLIEAFTRFSKLHPDYRLIIYGEGSEREYLENFAQKMGVADKVSMPGSVKDLWQRISSAKMFVMTSLFEGMSNSLIEAMCLGLPCISTKVSGATDLIKSGENGFLIDGLDDLCEKMEALCDDNFAARIGENASNLYEELKVENISRQWIDYIDKIAKR